MSPSKSSVYDSFFFQFSNVFWHIHQAFRLITDPPEKKPRFHNPFLSRLWIPFLSGICPWDKSLFFPFCCFSSCRVSARRLETPEEKLRGYHLGRNSHFEAAEKAEENVPAADAGKLGSSAFLSARHYPDDCLPLYPDLWHSDCFPQLQSQKRHLGQSVGRTQELSAFLHFL